jgi:hypothetical protein
MVNAPGLSPATHSGVLYVAGYKIGPIALSATAPGCSTAAAGYLNCTVPVKAPVGQNETISGNTFGSSDGSGASLAARSGSTVSVLANQTNYYTFAMYGVASKLQISAQPTTFMQGQWMQATVTVTGVDAGGGTIPSTPLVDPAGQSFAVQASATAGQNTSALATLISTASSFQTQYTYDGAASGSLAFSATAQGFTTAMASYPIKSGPTATAQIFAGSSNQPGTDNYFPYLTQFSASASGNAAPLRALAVNGSVSPFGADGSGNFWAGSTRYTGSGQSIGTINPTYNIVAVDPAQNAYGVVSVGGGSLARLAESR